MISADFWPWYSSSWENNWWQTLFGTIFLGIVILVVAAIIIVIAVACVVIYIEELKEAIQKKDWFNIVWINIIAFLVVSGIGFILATVFHG